MKKNTTKILMAALALFMAIGIATGTTFAWFAMQTTVTATGMQIEVKSNSSFLLINTGDNDSAAEIQSANTTTIALTVAAADADVYPSKPYLADAKDETGLGATAITTKDLAATVGNWYTANSSDPAAWGSVGDKTINEIVLTTSGTSATTAFDKYVIKKTAYLTLAVGSTNANNLTVTGNIVPRDLTAPASGTAEAGKTYYSYNDSTKVYTKETVTVGSTDVGTFYSKTTAVGDPDTYNIKAVKVLVVTDNNVVAVLSVADNGTPVNLYTGTGSQNNDITDSAVHTVDIYIYYDGTEDVVTSNAKASLAAAAIDLQFDVAVHEGA